MNKTSSDPNGSGQELQRQADELKAELATIEARMAARRKKLEEARRRVHKADEADQRQERRINEALCRLEVVPLGKADAIKIRHRRSEGKAARLNDLRGTLVEVKRTRGIVNFPGEARPWSFPLDELQPAGEMQGMVINL